jgi:hypothetical protein
MGRPKKVVLIEPLEPLEINEPEDQPITPLEKTEPEDQPIKPLEKSEISDSEEVDTFEEILEPVAKKPRKKMNLTDEEREKRRLRLRENNKVYLEEKKLKKIQAKLEEEEEKNRIHEELQKIKDALVIKKAQKVIDKKNKVSKKLQKILELSYEDAPFKKVELVKIEPLEFPVKTQRKPRVQRDVISNTYRHDPIINFL